MSEKLTQAALVRYGWKTGKLTNVRRVLKGTKGHLKAPDFYFSQKVASRGERRVAKNPSGRILVVGLGPQKEQPVRGAGVCRRGAVLLFRPCVYMFNLLR